MQIFIYSKLLYQCIYSHPLPCFLPVCRADRTYKLIWPQQNTSVSCWHTSAAIKVASAQVGGDLINCSPAKSAVHTHLSPRMRRRTMCILAGRGRGGQLISCCLAAPLDAMCFKVIFLARRLLFMLRHKSSALPQVSTFISNLTLLA